jgi:hypothetical protein
MAHKIRVLVRRARKTSALLGFFTSSGIPGIFGTGFATGNDNSRKKFATLSRESG